MKKIIRNIYVIIVAALYISPIAAMPFQIDFSMHWRVPQSILRLGFGETETLTFSSFVDSDNVTEITAAQPSPNLFSTDKHNIYLFSASNIGLSDISYGSKLWLEDGLSNISYVSDAASLPGTLTIKGDLKPDVASAVIQLIDEQGLHFSPFLYPVGSEIEMAAASSIVSSMANSMESAEKSDSSFSFLAGQQLQSQTVPDPAPLWLVGLVLGLVGLVRSLLGLINQVVFSD